MAESLDVLLAKLPPKRAAFVREYLVDLNATKAAVRAGYAPRAASQMGFDLLRNPKVNAAIQAAKASRAERVDVTADRTLVELARLGFTDMRHYADWDEHGVRIKPSEELTEDQARAVLQVKSKRRTIPQKGQDPIVEVEVDVKLHDKLRALESIGKHLGLFEVNTVTPEAVNTFLASIVQVLQRHLPGDRVMPILLELKQAVQILGSGGDDGS